MSNKGFTHLHLHSQYSLLDGAITFDKLLKQCKHDEMDSVAVTDHGNMFGAVEFYIKAMSAHIKPILGIEAYLAPDSRLNRQKSSISDAAYHLILLAENNTGYRNLLKLASIGYTEGFYYRPRIDKEVLADLKDGLIATSACVKGEIASLLRGGDEKRAMEAAESYIEIFGSDNFFIEIQKHQGDEPHIREGLIDIAHKTGLGLVATNDAHFLQEDDHEAHNCLCCISTNKLADDPDRMIYPSDIYFKNSEQMRQDFAEVIEACDNTLMIAERCNVELDLKKRHAPVFQPPDGSSPEEFLTQLVFERAKGVYGKVTDKVKSRIERELDVIESKGFASYFLIVWDFCNYAQQNNIPVGARGSAVGTVVGYCLGLCDIDPLKYDLLFERFMDPHRNEMPDVDIDICQDSRPKIIDYVRHKYGHVAQIITFGTMKARAVIRDICRVLGVPLAEADRLAKLVTAALGMTIDKALKSEPELKKSYERDDQTRRVIDICKKLEGLTRHASIHAAGIVIADQPLTDFLPLYKAPGSDDIVTQFEGPMVEKVGLLKMDFLGLKTLSVLEQTKKLVQRIHGAEVDLEKIPLDDKKVFELFAKGQTKGIFQFE
ncbi:MAG: DNA polymerase III subunit alpha, partial [Planctomycetota bacterium]